MKKMNLTIILLASLLPYPLWAVQDSGTTFAADALKPFLDSGEFSSAVVPLTAPLHGGDGGCSIFVEPESSKAGTKVELVANGDFTDVFVTSSEPLSFVHLVWNERHGENALVRGDAWERTYGDTGWDKIDLNRALPWYYHIADGNLLMARGVAVQPNALCCWRVGMDRTVLQIDLRAGGVPVKLGGRRLLACRVTEMRRNNGREGDFAFARRFCRRMMTAPVGKLPPVYGYNDWYCAYGRNTAANFIADVKVISDLTWGLTNRPYAVVDDGWQPNVPGVWCEWTGSSKRFGMPMDEFAGKLSKLGFKPGLWYRPLLPREKTPASRLLEGGESLDPSNPEVLETVAGDIRRFREWGYELVKIDFITYEFCHGWGFNFGDRIVHGEMRFADESHTTAEIVTRMYRTFRDAAGDGMVLIGCNAINHLAAGIFDLQRIGDDTSGNEWERTCKMGVNALAFRAEQSGIFFQGDADCVGLAKKGAIDWSRNRQWLDLVARSGTPLFVSWKRSLMDDEVRTALKEAFRKASEPRAVGFPLDWRETRRPRRWRFADGDVEYDWR